MTSLGPRFCPRCGSARAADMPFCPACGLNLAELDDRATAGAGDQRVATEVANGTTAAAERSPSPSVGDRDGGRPSLVASLTATGRSVDRGFRVPLVIALIVIVGLIILGLLPQPQLRGNPGSVPGLASGAPAAPIVGLTILSPSDGQAVASKDVIVIGMAPPGLTITQDVSFGFDQHTTVDGTGHWAIKVGLNDGDNKLTFRIGDDHSTQRTIRVIYTPAQAP